MEFNIKLMKKLLVLTFILPFSFLKAQVSVEVQQPELNVLYANYHNIIIPTAEGFKNITLSAPGCRVTPTTYNGKKGYEVQPSAGMRTVTISSSGKDAQGKIVSFGTTEYKVKSFPKPFFYNESISKSSGAKIEVGLGLDCPLNANFEVVLIGINNQTIEGNIISPEFIKNVEVGKNVALTIVAKNTITGNTENILCALKITD